MAFKLTIAGTDWTSRVVRDGSNDPHITMKQNERSTATFRLTPGTSPASAPNQFDEVIIYDVDGVTKQFDGVLTVATSVGIEPGSTGRFLDIQCVDFMFYTDTSYWTKTYTTGQTVKQILTDLIADKLGTYGITLDAAQDNGDTISAFTVTRVKVSDFLRTLGTQCNPQRTIRLTPAKAISCLAPGATSSPLDITDANPHVVSFEWQHTNFVPANYVELVCGPTGPLVTTQNWTYAGSFPLEADVQAVNGGWNQGYVTESVGPVNRTVSPPGGGGYYIFDPTGGAHGRGALSLGTGVAPANGTVLTFNYTAIFPFSVFAPSTPPGFPIEAQYKDEKQLLRAPAQLEVNGLLAELNQSGLKNATAVFWNKGFLPGQSINVQLTNRDLPSVTTFTIGQVEAVFTEFSDTTGVRLWKYTLQITQTTKFQGTYLDQARDIFGGSSSGIALVSQGGGSGGGTIGGSGTTGDIAIFTSPTNIGSEHLITAAQGGTGLDTSGSSGLPSVNAGAWAFNSLTSPRVLIAGAANTVTSSAGLTYSGTTLLVNNLITTPAATDLQLNPTQNLVTNTTNVLPNVGYLTNVGALNNKYLTLYAAELWVETLVAQNTLATIGGRILVAPTNQLSQDLAPQLATPGAPTITNGGASGGTTYKYRISAIDGNGETLASTEGQITNAVATLTGTNFNHVTWSAVSGAVSYNVYGRTAGAELWMTNTTSLSFNDTGAITPNGTLPTANYTSSTIYTKYNNLTNGDILYSEANGKVEFYQVNAWAIVALNQGAKTFTVQGDAMNAFNVANRTLTISGSTGNDGTYTVVSASYAVGTSGGGTQGNGRTTITVSQAIPNATANGNIVYGNTASTTTPANQYIYTVSRDLDGSGSDQWFAGDALLDTGTTGNGFIDLYSLRGVKASTEVGPTIVGNVRNSSTYNDWSPRWAIGNLNGLYGYVATTYGVAMGNPAADNIVIDATNGIRFRSGTTVRGSITAGTFTFGTAAHGISWDGTTLSLTGAFIWNTTSSVDSVSMSLAVDLKMNALNKIYPGLTSGSGFQTTTYVACISSAYVYTNGSYSAQAGYYFNNATHVGNAYVTCDTGDRVAIYAGSPSAGIGWDGINFLPFTDNVANCGVNGIAWVAVWSHAYPGSSDASLKYDIGPCTLGTEFLMRLRPTDYRFKTDGPGLPRRHGFLKHEVPTEFGGHYPMSLDYTVFVAPLVVGFQDHERRLHDLERRLESVV